jgi:SAM-dependent methyltransferase
MRNGIERVNSRFAAPYDWLSDTIWAGQWRTWQRALLPFVQGPRVLEVGIGTGRLQLDLIELGVQTYGIDRAPSMLRVASRKVLAATGRPLSACRADVTALPFPDNTFNSVLSANASGYILLPQTHSEVERVLSPGGRFAIMTGGILAPGVRMKAFRRALHIGRPTSAPPADAPLVIYPYDTETQQLGYWVSTIKHHMESVHLHVSMYVAPTPTGSAFLIVGDKDGSDAEA